jgi:hypothetical protein
MLKTWMLFWALIAWGRKCQLRSARLKVQREPLTSRWNQFPVSDQISYFAIPAFLSIVFLVISLWIFGLRRTEPAGRAFSMMASSLAIVIGSLFDLYTSHRFTYVWTMAAAYPAAP